MKKLDVINPFHNAPVWYTGTIDTTMRAARELFVAERESGIVVSAGYQSAGRGRTKNRKWDSNPGDNLLMTLALDKKDFSGQLQLLPLLTGLGVADLLESLFSIRPEIKWPNDVIINGRKICGILCDATVDCLLIGIGLNLWQQNFPPSLSGIPFPPTSIISESPLTVKMDREKVIQKLLTALHTSFRSVDWQDRLQSKLYGMHKVVEFAVGEADGGKDVHANRLSGVIQGVSDDGGLIIDSTTWYTGEISSVKFSDSSQDANISAGESNPDYHFNWDDLYDKKKSDE
jgi:BirA family transcriptional regulator, biotin operon repressor / biotin---[acetyl-CoA-carboxylase] ligase